MCLSPIVSQERCNESCARFIFIFTRGFIFTWDILRRAYLRHHLLWMPLQWFSCKLTLDEIAVLCCWVPLSNLLPDTMNAPRLIHHLLIILMYLCLNFASCSGLGSGGISAVYCVSSWKLLAIRQMCSSCVLLFAETQRAGLQSRTAESVLTRPGP